MNVTPRTLIGAFTVIVSNLLMLGLLFVPVPEANQTLWNVGLGNVWASANLVLGYYFGSSKVQETQEPKDK